MKKTLAFALAAAAALATSAPAYAACGIWGWLGYCKPTNF